MPIYLLYALLSCFLFGSQEMCGRLDADIRRIKLQKVALQKTMEGSAKQFAQWRQDREKVSVLFVLRCLCVRV